MRLTRSVLVGNADTAGVSNLIVTVGGTQRVQVDNSTLDGNFASNRLLLGGNGDSVLDAEALTITRNTAPCRGGCRERRGDASQQRHRRQLPARGLRHATSAAPSPTPAACSCRTRAATRPRRSEDPLLGPLAANGGTTLNRLPLFGSPLLNTGVAPVLEPLFDQRNLQRVQFGATDIGAVESTAR